MFFRKSRNQTRNNGLSKKLFGHRKLAGSRSIAVEALEERHLLSVSSAFIGTEFLSTGTDVNASVINNSQTETHVAVNPTAPGNAVVMANGGLNSNEFTAFTTDGAATFTATPVGNAQDGQGGGSRFDGATAFDRFGNVHIVYMARPVFPGPSAIVHAMSSDGGQTYTIVNNIVSPPADIDKPWITTGVDASNPANEVVLITYQDTSDDIVATAAQVTGLGAMGAFSVPVTVSDASGGNYAVPTIGPDGEFVVTWQDPSSGQGTVTIFVDRDLDGLTGGLTFGGDITVTTSDAGGFDFIPATPERSTFASPYVAYDTSDGPFGGVLYLAYADEIPDESDDFDIFLRRSFNDGATWTAPVQVNDDTGTNSQFFQNISVDPVTGFVFLSWFDARNDLNDGSAGDIDSDNAANSEVEYFATASLDGGVTFLPNIRASDGTSDEDRADPNTNDFGDYTGTAAYAGLAYLAWPDNSNSTGDNPQGNTTFDVYVDRVVVQSTGGIVVNVCGDEDFVNQDDTFVIRLDASGTFVEILVNGVLEFIAPKSAASQINVFGVGGNDELIVDSTNGLISLGGGAIPPALGGGTIPNNGIRYDGDGACPPEFFDGEGFGFGGYGYDRGVDTLTLQQTGGPTHLTDTLSVGATVSTGVSTIVGVGAGNTQTVFFEELEPIVDGVPAGFLIIDGGVVGTLLNEANAISYESSDLFGPTWGKVTIDAFEPIHFTNKTNLLINALAGADDVELNNANLPTGLQFITVLGGAHDDHIAFLALPDASATTFVSYSAFGEAGEDTIDARWIAVNTPGFLNGGSENDLLVGGRGNDILSGGDGDDVLIGGDPAFAANIGNNNYNGTAGFDTIGILGTLANDRIDVNQTTSLALTSTVNLITSNEIFDNAEQVRIEALEGDDIIRVRHADALVATPADSLRFHVLGGPPGASDRLAVVDDGLGDLVIHRIGQDDSNGTINVGPLAPVVYEDIEHAEVPVTNVITASTGTDNAGRLVVFKHDPLEENDTLPNATFVGVGVAINVDPTIDPPGDVPFELPGDEDWYQVEALASGTLDFQVFFEQIGTLGNGRPGLPGNGDISLELYDSDGLPVAIAGFGVNDANNDERIRIPAVQGQVYYLRVFGATEDVVNVYNLTVINEPAPVPFDLELQDNPVNPIPNPPGGGPNSDTGRSQFDNVTYDNTPTLFLRLDDGFFLHDLPGNAANDTPPDEVIVIPFSGVNLAAGYRIAIFDEGTTATQVGTAPQIPLGFAVATAQEGVYTFTTPVLTDGSHFLSARVQMIDPATPTQTGFGERSVSLEIIVDTVEPNVSFGDPLDPDDGLQPDSDTGVAPPNEDTLVDRITSDTTPSFWGRAEANSIIRLFVDHPVLGIPGTLDPADIFIGQDTAIPLDGTNQEPDGYWEIDSVVNFNDPAIFPVVPPNTVPDGLRTVFVTAEDLAGNVNPDTGAQQQVAQRLDIFIDTQGPRITDVEITDYPDYDLFNPKGPLANQQGPTPVTQRITISFTDLPFRDAPDFLFVALKPETVITDHFQVFGDQVGRIAIDQVILNQVAPADGQAATATVTLVFHSPLPDDRFTLVVTDDVRDIAGNRLDGETNAAEPQEDPRFPSGDGVPGGDFIARFTIDTRPELGVYAGIRVYIDLNGNAVFDPEGQDNDAVNRDIVFRFGSTSDSLFAGQFVSPGRPLTNVPAPAAPEVPGRFFDQIAAYGNVLGAFRFVFDFNSDGVADLVTTQDPGFQIDGVPVAGNFDLNFANGDEVGLFDGVRWWFDTNHDFEINGLDAPPVLSAIRGFPQVGDVDGDTLDDLITFQNDTFFFDFATNGYGQLDESIPLALEGGGLGFPGVSERPTVADMNQDGIDDIGVWVPGNLGQTVGEISEFYFLVSKIPPNPDIPIIVTHVPGAPIPAAIPGTLWAFPETTVPGSSSPPTAFFQPVPFGTSLFAIFGDEPAFPIVGNFDPPVGNDIDSAGPDTDGTLVGHPNIVVASKGAGADPKVVVYDRDSGEVVMELTPYNPSFRGGVQVATADVNGDGVLDIITAPGRGNTPLVRVFDGRTGQSIRDFFAYDPNFTGGVFIAVGDFDADDRADIVTAPAKGGGPQIRVFSGADGHRMANFFAYDRAFTGGVHVAVGNTDGVGHPEIITAPDRGGGPQVRTFNLAGQRLNQIIAYDSKFTGGVFVASGDVDGDGRADIITGAGAGGGPQVRVFSGADSHRMASYFAYANSFFGGVRVATGDFDGDGRADIYTSSGAGAAQPVRVFDGDNLSQLASFSAFPASFTGGVFIAAPAATGAQALHATSEGAGGAVLLLADLDTVLAAAMSQSGQADVLSQIPVRIVDLPGTYLGLAYRDEILIDVNAAGHGWFVDSTPDTSDDLDASQIDLLSVVAHELGHILGLEDLHVDSNELMSEVISAGERHSTAQAVDAVDAVFSGLDLG